MTKNNHIGWKRIRVLVTNKCNYQCPFCHNEGQSKEHSPMNMSLNDFKTFVTYLQNEDIEELHFSGGEPFLNPYIVDMIRFADDKLSCDIGCATNLSRITDEQLTLLRGSRVKFNIQFPFATKEAFKKSTGNGDYDGILKMIEKVRDSGLKVGLNSVVQSNDTSAIRKLIEFSIKSKCPLKLLPQIGLKDSDKFKDFIVPIVQEYATSYVDKGTGALRWNMEFDGKKTSLLYIDSPCFYNDIISCRNFGEIRINPDFSMQSCILRQPSDKLQIARGKEYVINQLSELWKNFMTC